jgi:hypothetical protein
MHISAVTVTRKSESQKNTRYFVPLQTVRQQGQLLRTGDKILGNAMKLHF